MPARSSKTSSAQTLTVVSYNIRAGIGPGPFPPAWWRRIDDGRVRAMADFALAADADVVCLQEVGLLSIDGRAVDQPALLAEHTGWDVQYGAVCALPLVEPEPPGRVVGAYLWGNALLSRHPITSVVVDALPVTPDDDPSDPVDTEPRCVLWCVLDTPAGAVTVGTTHLAWLGTRARAPQAAHLAARLAAQSGPVVLAGDLNAPIEAAELAPLALLATDAFAAAGVPAGDERRESCGRDRIDHVLVRGPEVLECRVAREAGDLSDHWPLVTRLAL